MLKKYIYYALTLILLTTPSYAESEKFPRALVFSGGGFQTALYIGMLHGLQSEGWEPEVILSTCGSTLAAAIINALPDLQAQKRFLYSQEFYNTIHSAKLARPSTFGALSHLGNLYWNDDKIHNIFQNPFVEVPMTLSFSSILDQSFNSDKTRVIMVSGRILYDLSDVDQSRVGRELFQEVFFTDDDTANKLHGFESPIPYLFPESPIIEKTDVMTGHTLWTGTRAGIADPFFIAPIQVDNTYYGTGAFDLYPIELAKHIADEVVMMYSAHFIDIEETVMNAVYAQENNRRLRDVTSQFADHWIDMSDANDFFENSGFNPKPGVSQIRSGVPDNQTDFNKKIDAQYQRGFERGAEAIRTKKDSRLHIRNMNELNSSFKIRQINNILKKEPWQYEGDFVVRAKAKWKHLDLPRKGLIEESYNQVETDDGIMWHVNRKSVNIFPSSSRAGSIEIQIKTEALMTETDFETYLKKKVKELQNL